jgi:hypothetical protein
MYDLIQNRIYHESISLEIGIAREQLMKASPIEFYENISKDFRVHTGSQPVRRRDMTSASIDLVNESGYRSQYCDWLRTERQRVRGSNPRWGKVFCSPRRRDRFWRPPSVIFNGLFPRG